MRSGVSKSVKFLLQYRESNLAFLMIYHGELITIV